MEILQLILIISSKTLMKRRFKAGRRKEFQIITNLKILNDF